MVSLAVVNGDTSDGYEIVLSSLGQCHERIIREELVESRNLDSMSIMKRSAKIIFCFIACKHFNRFGHTLH